MSEPAAEPAAQPVAETKPAPKIPRATLDLLRSKKRAEREVSVTVPGPDGDQKVSFLFRAISRAEYDALVDQHPPTKVQVAKGETFNQDTFGPALLAQVCVEPEIPAVEWGKFWRSKDWSPGEINGMFYTAVGLCNSGFDLVPTTESG